MNDVHFEPNKPDFKKLVLLSIQQLTNFPYIEADFDAITNYQLLCKVVEYLNQVIANNNEQNETILGLYNAYLELQNYVNNYFDNLDVQEEINNKLDEMVEAGTLQEIIADYLNSKAVFGYDTVANMKNATNLINGSYAETLGYYSINDGGNALYKIRTITNEDVVDERFIISLTNDNTLIAELVYHDEINALQIGLKNDNSTDCSTVINNLVNALDTNETIRIYFPYGIYKMSNQLSLKKYVILRGETPFIASVAGVSNNIVEDKLSILDFSSANIENNDCIDANSYHRKLFENLVIQSSSYSLIEDRTKTPAGNTPTDPVFTETISKTAQNGLHINGYGSIVRQCQFIGFSGIGLLTEQHNKLYDNEIDRCKIGVKIAKADNLIDNTRINLCGMGIEVSAALNTITNTRCDSIYGIGLKIDNYSQSNIIDNYVVDYSWLNGLYITQSSNYNRITNFKCRSAVKYAGFSYDDVPSENKKDACGIYIENYSGNNYISTNFNITSAMDTNDQTRLVPACQTVVDTVSGGNFIDVQYSSLGISDKVVSTTDFEKMFRATAGSNNIITRIKGNTYNVGSLSSSTDNYKITTVMNSITYPFTQTANSRTPLLRGLINVDTSGNVWISTGTSSSSDWVKVNNAS